MTARLAAALVLSFASAVALNWGFLAQHRAASRLPPLTLRRPLHSLGVLLRSRRWVVGSASGLAGWALYIAALSLAPLSLVQAASAGGIGALALLLQLGPGDRLTRVEWAGVALAVGGVAVLAATASAHSSGSPGGLQLALWLGGSVVAAAAVAGPWAVALPRGTGLGITSGLMYAAADVATKAATLGRLWLVPLVIVGSSAGFAALQLAFQRGAALATAGVSSVLTNALPIAAGVVVFGDTIQSGLRGWLHVLSFVLVIVGAAALVRASAASPASALP